jgi:hypothetical protein
MRQATLPLPEIAVIAGTRGMMGAGIGLLVSERLSQERRRRVGLALLLIGALSTIPLVLDVIGRTKRAAEVID